MTVGGEEGGGRRERCVPACEPHSQPLRPVAEHKEAAAHARDDTEEIAWQAKQLGPTAVHAPSLALQPHPRPLTQPVVG